MCLDYKELNNLIRISIKLKKDKECNYLFTVNYRIDNKIPAKLMNERGIRIRETCSKTFVCLLVGSQFHEKKNF